jgi:hypothetical protein
MFEANGVDKRFSTIFNAKCSKLKKICLQAMQQWRPLNGGGLNSDDKILNRLNIESTIL